MAKMATLPVKQTITHTIYFIQGIAIYKTSTELTCSKDIFAAFCGSHSGPLFSGLLSACGAGKSCREVPQRHRMFEEAARPIVQFVGTDLSCPRQHATQIPRIVSTSL